MKISELTPLSRIQDAAQIPVAIDGENRSVSIKLRLDALQSSIVIFKNFVVSGTNKTYTTGGTGLMTSPVYDTDTKKFWGAVYEYSEVTGITSAILYSDFSEKDSFYRNGEVRTDCLFAAEDGRLYRYANGLISCGLTDAQAELLKKLTPKELASEAELEALKAAGEIVPGQLYYVADAE